MKICSALYYALASSLITVLNKIVLSSYGFPSFQVLCFGQLVVTIIILFTARSFRLVSYPELRRDTFLKIFPLPLIFLGNAMTGLGGTKELNLPMFTVLRRFSILMTMLGELLFFKIHPSIAVQISVFTMIGGAILAAGNDLAFSLRGYTLVTMNNFLTAANGICIKKKLESKEYGQYGLMYYNALFMIIPTSLIAYASGEFRSAFDFVGWKDPMFVASFLLACVMGFILNASVVMCTHYNSALTTSIVGCLKNISVTYVGMLFSDFIFDWFNFVGINISVFGSLLYTYVTFMPSTT